MAKAELGAVSAAWAEVRARIRRQRFGQPWELKKVLAYLERHLLDAGLTVGKVAEACGLGRRELQRLFQDRLDSRPWELIRGCRMEVAADLLRNSDLAIRQIAEAVGYGSLKSFSKTFSAWADQAPSGYREQHQLTPAATPSFHQPGFRSRLNRGEAAAEHAALAIRYLEELYAVPGTPSAAPLADPSLHEGAAAEAVWRRIRELPPEEQEQVVRRHYGFRTPALFELLVEKSREAGRSDSRRRLRLAELARASLDALDPTPGSDLLDVKVRAWAYLAHARRLAFDLAGAEESLARAEVTWQVPRDRRDPRALADVYAAKAMLRYFQRRFERALYWNGKAVALLRELGTRAPLVNALLARAAIRGASGQAGAAAVADLREAFETLEELERPELRLSVFASLAATHALAGEYAEAARLLPRAQRLARSLRHHVARAHLRWVEGLIRKGQGDLPAAERLLRAARQQLAELENHDHSALVALELALLCAEAGRRTEALRWVAETIPFFEAFRIRREALAALRLIHEARDREALPLAILRQIRAAIGKLRNDPYFGQPVKIGDAPG